MAVLDRFRRDTGPEAMLTEREQRRVRDAVALELTPADDGRFPVERWQGAHAAELHRAAQVKAKRRARLAPWKAGGATAALGTGGWAAGLLAELVVGPVGHLVATGSTAAVAAGGALALSVMGRRRKRWGRSETVAATGAVAVAAVTSVAGPAWWVGMVLLGGTAAEAAAWRRALADGPAPAPPAVEDAARPVAVEPPPQDEGDRVAAQWAADVITPGGCIPGAAPLMDRTNLDRGYRWTIQLGRGDYFSKIAGLREPVAAALRRAPSSVLIEPYPGDSSRGLLTVITRDALASGVSYLGPLYHGGRIPIGLYADGESVAEIIVKDDGGVYPTAMTGDPRTGKSTAFEALAVALRQSGEWMVLFGDGDPGAGSSAILAEVAHWPEAGPRGALRQLECLEGIVQARQALKATLTVDPDTGRLAPITNPVGQRPAAKILPCPEYPGWMWMVDELHLFMRDEWLHAHDFGPRFERLLRIGPKYGVAVSGATHSRLNPDYRTSTCKGLLHAKNSLAFRAESSSERASINGILVNPSELPNTKGYAFSIQGGRLAMLRTGYPVVVPAEPFPTATPDADSWLGAKPWWPEAENDPASALEAAKLRLAEWRRKADARARGEQVTDEPQQQEMVPAATPQATGGFADVAREIPNLVRAAKVLPFPRRPGVADLTGLRLGVNAQAVLQTLLTRPGVWVTGEIVKTTGLDAPAVNKGTAELEQKGLAARPKWGTWELTEQGRQVAA